MLALQATAAVGLAVWLEPRLTDPAAAGQTVTELAATLMSDDGTVTKRISGVGAAALLAGVTALLIMAYQMGRGAGGGYSKPKRGSVGGSVVSQLKKIVGDKNVHTSGVEMSMWRLFCSTNLRSNHGTPTSDSSLAMYCCAAAGKTEIPFPDSLA